MTTTHALAPTAPYALARDEGQHFHFLNHLATVKAVPGETGTMSVVEFVGGRGFGPPLHRHNDEDELFFIVEGDMRFESGDIRTEAGDGGFVFLPHGRPHTFQVMSDSARFINVTASVSGAPRFDRMVAALGAPLETPELPDPIDIDPGRVAEICAAHGIDIVGPPPAPLD